MHDIFVISSTTPANGKTWSLTRAIDIKSDNVIIMDLCEINGIQPIHSSKSDGKISSL